MLIFLLISRQKSIFEKENQPSMKIDREFEEANRERCKNVFKNLCEQANMMREDRESFVERVLDNPSLTKEQKIECILLLSRPKIQK